jgi:O-antigen biosynthesis protein
VATKWDSCYQLLRHQACFGRKAYFIQDYEPYFFPRGDVQLLAEQTYGMGLHHLSLGGWNLERVRSELGIGGGDVLDFPVELGQYPLLRRPLRHGRTLRLAVYIKRDAKRAPSLLSLMLQAVAEAFRARGVATEARIFGMRSARARFAVGENCGTLRTPAIKALYAWADFGVVASLTNISLVNYEMLACGLPVVDLRGGSAPFFFDETEMLFAHPSPGGLEELLRGAWGREETLAAMVDRAQGKIRDRQWTWEQAARQFEAALRRPFPGRGP